jgi:anti-anti-sigma factor
MILIKNDSYIYQIKEHLCYFKVTVASLEVINNYFLHLLSIGSIYEQIQQNEITSIIIDLEDVSYADSCSLGIFISILKEAKTKKYTIQFANVHDHIKEVLVALNLYSFFHIIETPIQPSWGTQ